MLPINPDILYSSLKAMIDNIIYHKTQKKKRKIFHSDSIKQIYDNSQLTNLCSASDFCVIGLFNATNEQEYINSFNQNIEKFEILASKNKFKGASWGWVNVTCQTEMAEKFDIPKKGGVIIYQQWKEIYSRFIFPTDDLQLVNFFEKTFENKFVFNDLKPSDLKLNDHDCLADTKKKIKLQEENEKNEVEEQKKNKKNFDPSMKTDL